MIFTGLSVVLLISASSIERSSANFFSFESSNKHVNDNAIIKDPVSDLSWLRALPLVGAQQSSTKQLSNQKLDVGASAFHNSFVPSVYSSDRFSNLLSMSSIPGKRRLDLSNENIDIAALASNGRFNGYNGRHKFAGKMPLMGDDLGATSPTNNQALRTNQRHQSRASNQNNFSGNDDQITNNNQNYNRRALVPNSRGKQSGGRAHKTSYNQQQQLEGRQVNLRQESRKKAMKPLVGGQKSREQDDVDEDEAEEDKSHRAQAGRRSGRGDEDDDSESNDDDDGDSGVEPKSRVSSARLGTAPSKQKVNRQKQRTADDEVDADEGEDKSSDEDIDSTNLSGVSANEAAAEPLREDIVMRRRLSARRPAGRSSEAQPEKKQQSLDSDGGVSQGDPINLAPTAEEIDESASHVRHSSTDLQTAAGSHHGHHGHYYQHVEVPKKKSWKFGFKRGNHKHEIMRHEKGHKHKFHSSFKWHAKEKCKKKKHCKSVGKMTWEYKHAKKHHP